MAIWQAQYAWLGRVEGTEGFLNDLAPFPAHVTERPI